MTFSHRITKENGVFECNLKDGKAHGKAIYSYTNGDVFDCTYRDGIANGHGTYTYENGNVLQCFFQNGVPHGHGIKKYVSGCTFVCEWSRDLRANGNGTMLYSRGEWLSCKWVDGVPCGQGVERDRKGNIFLCKWKDGRRNGSGIHTFTNGDVLKCEYEDGFPSTTGVIEYINGDRYEGGIQNLQPFGRGRLMFAAGGTLESESWDGSNANGSCTRTYADGGVLKCEFRAGKRADGTFTITYPSKATFAGEWKFGKPSGMGIKTYSNGDTIEGEWADTDEGVEFSDWCVIQRQSVSKDDALHDATSLFLDHTMSEVVQETEQLQITKEHQRLIDFASGVQLRFRATGDGQDYVKVLTYAGALGKATDPSCWKVPLDRCEPIPMWSKGMEAMLVISNQIVGFKTDISPSFDQNAANEVHIYLVPKTPETCTEIVGWICAELVFLREGDDQKKWTRECLLKYIRTSIEPCLAFIPFQLTVYDGSLKSDKIFKLLRTASNDVHHVSNIARHSIIHSIGTKSDMTLLMMNSNMKWFSSNDSYSEVKDIIDDIELSCYYQLPDEAEQVIHLSGTLSEGQLVTAYSNGEDTFDAWVIQLPRDIQRIEIRQNLMGEVVLYVSGVSIGGYNRHYREGFLYLIFDRHNALVRVEREENEHGTVSHTIIEVAFRLEGIKETLDALDVDYS